MRDQTSEAIAVLEETIEAQKQKSVFASPSKPLGSTAGASEANPAQQKPSQRGRREEDFELINNLAELYISTSQFEEVLFLSVR